MLTGRFLEDVREGRHLERGWSNTLYASSKVGECATAMIHARELQNSGECCIKKRACS